MTRRILLTGATGFVGRAVRPALEAAGWQVRCLTRNVSRARADAPNLEWVEGDVSDADACARAMEGCDAALYLVHGIGEGADYHTQEVRAAHTFARAAASAQVRRIVYLGGVAPGHANGSEHLRSRLAVGEALRSGSVHAIELRASMIVGEGSLSWLIVRDLAARLPFMVLPRWLRSRTEPVAIDDVVTALVRALDLPVDGSAWFDIPGPEVLSGRVILERTARVLGLGQPRMMQVPLLTPRLSSHWVRFVTRARWSVAREVVVGLTEDLLAHDDRFWGLIGHARRLTFSEAARKALDAGPAVSTVSGLWGWIERARVEQAPRSATSTRILAVVCVAAWTAAAALSSMFGLWTAVGSIAVLLGLVVTLFDPVAVRTALRPTTALCATGLAVGVLMSMATYGLYPILVHAVPAVTADTALLYGAFRAPAPAVIWLALVPVVVGEELVWRGAIQRVLTDQLGFVGRPWVAASAAVIVTAVIYACAHALIGSPVLVLVTFGCGLVWSGLRAATGSVTPALVAHLIWDALVLLWLPLG